MARLNLASGTGGAVGFGTPIAMRQFVDQPGDTSLTRPSVLTGVGGGVLALGAYWAMKKGMFHGGMQMEDALFAAGVGGVLGGATVAFFPAGSGLNVQMPTL